MRYLFDSNIVSYLYNDDSEHHEAIHAKISGLKDNDEIYVSVLTFYEQEYGFANAPESKKPLIRQRILAVKSDFQTIPLTYEGAKIFGELKKALKERWDAQKSNEAKQENMKKHNVDVMLASAAIVHSCILISNDSLYADLAATYENFKYENWLA